MPTYEYECESCKHAFEILQSMTDKKLKKCPKCGKNTLYRLIGAGTGVIFKGSGFYQTDYKKKEAVKTETSAKPAGQTCASKPGSCGCAHSH